MNAEAVNIKEINTASINTKVNAVVLRLTSVSNIGAA
jgi:hypothetical protein